MSLINISNLTFCYDGSFDNIFENVSIQLDTDWKLGFIGRNGRGKTTFLNLLMGKFEFGGTISTSVNFDYFPFHVEDQARNTLEVINNLCTDYKLWQLKKELSQLEVSEDILYRSFCTLSNGEQTKVMLAALFLKSNHFLLIDEPTNHLDLHGRSVVSNYLKGKYGFILVSHDREFLDNCIDHVLSINKTNIDIQKGNFSSWWYNKELNDKYELAENDKLHNDISKMEMAAKRTAQWSDNAEKRKIGNGPCDRGYIGHKAAKMMKRSKAIEARQQKAIDEKSKLLKNLETADHLSISPTKYHNSRLLETKELSIHYGNKLVCENINLSVMQGDRVALCGKNGCGKSSILKLMLKAPISFSGSLSIGAGLIISYVPQDTSFLNGNLKDFARNNGIDESLFKAILRKLDFSRIQFEKDMQDFSGGQKKKVLIAKSLCEKAHLYIWDEPLNYIDVISRIQIEALILEYKPTMLFVEHDSSFVNAVATKCLQL